MSSFRSMRRANQALSEDEIHEVLCSARRGVLSVTGDNGWPYGVYVNPFYDEESGKLYFHGGKIGHKIDALRRDPRACFTVIDEGTHDASRPPAWALTFRSVVVFGRVEFVDDHEAALDICRRLCRRFPMDEAAIEKEIQLAGFAVLVFALVPEHRVRLASATPRRLRRGADVRLSAGVFRPCACAAPISVTNNHGDLTP